MTTKKTLPPYAKLPINRCNLPAEVLGDLSFQSNPKPIHIDGIAQLHKHLFEQLDVEPNPSLRSKLFGQYLSAHFSLDNLDDVGYDTTSTLDRSRANYLRVLRGWFFNSDSVEGAVIKSWVESRFGLIPRYHKNPIHSIEDVAYAQFESHRSRGLYNTNALEAQFDLLYSYNQYELLHRFPGKNSIVLYRGQNNLKSLEQILLKRFPAKKTQQENKSSMLLLLNNISSFTSNAARAGEFGDIVFSVDVPFAKLLFFSGLMPGIMSSEREFAVIGGVYDVRLIMDVNHQKHFL